MGWPENELARKLRFPLMQKSTWSIGRHQKHVRQVLSDKQVEQSRKRQHSPTEKDIKGSSNIINRVRVREF
jgi:hypothetical protein